ncbi:hypothetical protein [Leptolinea tardivitalis]|nr:hypothetical protein [Leptolinea tardivitalis]GAP22739.1 hypothetical protein LTAR_02978 [Leptolinea tardivitalis]
MNKYRLNSGLIIKTLLQFLILLLAFLALQDLYYHFPLFSVKWRIVFVVISFTYIAGILLFFLAMFTQKLDRYLGWIKQKIILGVRWTILLTACCSVIIFLLYTDFGSYFQGQFFRLSVYLFLSTLFSLLLSPNKTQKFDFLFFFFSAGLIGYIFSLANYATEISTYPFSHSWSEGNRFYDYSLIFGQHIYKYNGQLVPNYESPGRYGLWGFWFIFPSIPIWAHRLWNAILWTITPFILSISITRKINHPFLRWTIVFWFSLFIMQGPVYPTLLLALIFLTSGIWSNNRWVKGGFAILSSIFAGMSRYFWIIVPGVWLVLVDLFFVYPERKGTKIQKLIPTIVWGLVGVLPGTYFGLKQLFSPKAPFEIHQPLLFYRLLPNSTYPLGIIINFFIDFSPTLVLLIWILYKSKQKFDVITKLGIAFALSGFALMGFIASTKIGGGSNLHNLDMFIVTIGLIMIILVILMQENMASVITKWPLLIKIFLFIVVLTPGWMAMRTGSKLVNPPDKLVQESLETIRYQVNKAKLHGEVLFIDQRQLLTFEYIKDVKLVPEYEKKYMMDQAMGENTSYFEKFYKDLQNSRFAMIISDPLTTNLQGRDQGFSEENNAYVTLVSKPILAYYQPLITLKGVEVQLLVPKTNCRIIPGAMLIFDCNY